MQVSHLVTGIWPFILENWNLSLCIILIKQSTSLYPEINDKHGFGCELILSPGAVWCCSSLTVPEPFSDFSLVGLFISLTLNHQQKSASIIWAAFMIVSKVARLPSVVCSPSTSPWWMANWFLFWLQGKKFVILRVKLLSMMHFSIRQDTTCLSN